MDYEHTLDQLDDILRWQRGWKYFRLFFVLLLLANAGFMSYMYWQATHDPDIIANRHLIAPGFELGFGGVYILIIFPAIVCLVWWIWLYLPLARKVRRTKRIREIVAKKSEREEPLTDKEWRLVQDALGDMRIP